MRIGILIDICDFWLTTKWYIWRAQTFWSGGLNAMGRLLIVKLAHEFSVRVVGIIGRILINLLYIFKIKYNKNKYD